MRPRPPSVQWPKGTPSNGTCSTIGSSSACTGTTAAKAFSRCSLLGFEGALVALGQESPFAKPLIDASKAAKAKLNVPLGERVDACQKFFERARKRLAQAQQALDDVAAAKDQCVEEVEEGEKRLKRFREEARVPVPMLPVPWDVVDLPSRIDELVRERDALRAGAAPSSFWRNWSRSSSRM